MKNIYHDQNIYRGELMLRPVEQSDISAIESIVTDPGITMMLDFPKRDYKEALKRYVNDSDFRQEEEILFEKSEKYGEIIIPDNLEKEWFYSDQFGLFSKTSV